MTLIDILLAALLFLLKGIVLLVLLGLALVIFIVLREVAWLLKHNRGKQEEKKNEDGGI